MDVIHRVTKEIRRSVDVTTGAYPETLWVHLEDASSFLGVPSRYILIEEGGVREATSEEKHAIDLACLPEAKSTLIKRLLFDTNDYIQSRYVEPVQRMLLADWIKAVQFGFVNRAHYIKRAHDWVDEVVRYYYNKKSEILSTECLESLNAITWDFSQFNASDPKVSREEAIAIPD